MEREIYEELSLDQEFCNSLYNVYIHSVLYNNQTDVMTSMFHLSIHHICFRRHLLKFLRCPSPFLRERASPPTNLLPRCVLGSYSLVGVGPLVLRFTNSLLTFSYMNKIFL